MSPGLRVAAFVAVLAAVFAAAMLAGAAIDPAGQRGGAPSSAHMQVVRP